MNDLICSMLWERKRRGGRGAPVALDARCDVAFYNQSQRSQPQQPATTQTVRQLFLSLSLSQEGGTLRALCKCKRALVAGNGLLLLQQISGQPSVLYYAVTVFKSAGFGKSSSTLAS
eukprot:CAMPEP_0114279934 /NCGR_PEP_ID=MMETSP0059-20121206/2166_1 /TAXON_ID=36894 /ORGANISM="Pyramimonas parkeae, Strain CCMP726" /LENGTH=116 /DNA_ID=CAMNT_0001400295 /DNA_START=838 /DNA_END=1185 /DNA_ORIENTATION=+